MFCIQALDHEEGTGARWFDLKGILSGFSTRQEAREWLSRAKEAWGDSDCLYSYRIVEVGSPEYYSQPTDALEY